MQVNVKVVRGTFNRKERGQLVTYEVGATLTVSQHVWEKFADKFEVIGKPPESRKHIRRPPVPGTDDAPEPTPPGAEEPRIIVTGRQRVEPDKSDEQPLKTGIDVAEGEEAEISGDGSGTAAQEIEKPDPATPESTGAAATDSAGDAQQASSAASSGGKRSQSSTPARVSKKKSAAKSGSAK